MGLRLSLLGDPVDYVYDALGRQVAVTDPLGTYQGFGKSNLIIDYIFYDGFSACPLYKTLTDTYAGKPYISDHYPIEAVLEF